MDSVPEVDPFDCIARIVAAHRAYMERLGHLEVVTLMERLVKVLREP